MTNRFNIDNLDSIVDNVPAMTSSDMFAVQRDSMAYKVSFEDIAKDVIGNRLALKSGRKSRKGHNVLSIMFVNDDQTSSFMLSTTLQDGILSSATIDESTNTIVLKFNSTDPEESDISVSLSSLVDVYNPGYGLSCQDVDGQKQFYVDINAVVDLSSAQTIAGNKRFNGGITMVDGHPLSSVSTTSAELVDAAQNALDIPSSKAVNELLQSLNDKIDALCATVSALTSS